MCTRYTPTICLDHACSSCIWIIGVSSFYIHLLSIFHDMPQCIRTYRMSHRSHFKSLTLANVSWCNSFSVGKSPSGQLSFLPWGLWWRFLARLPWISCYCSNAEEENITESMRHAWDTSPGWLLDSDFGIGWFHSFSIQFPEKPEVILSPLVLNLSPMPSFLLSGMLACGI